MKYHVYGIGNALVDKEFEVSDEFLAEHNIEKGMMSLLDEEAHHQLLDKLQSNFSLKKRAGGGSAANSIVAISQLGGSTFYACKVANDEFGSFYCEDLHAAGVQTKLDGINVDGHTGKCMVMVTPDAERTMNTFLGITSDFSEEELHFDELKKSEYLYIEGYLVTSDISRAAAIQAKQFAKENNIKTAMTFSDPSMVTYFKDGVTEMLGDGVDILFCNEEECMTFTGKDTLDDAIAELSRQVRKLVITQGKNGATVIHGEQKTNIDPVTAKAIDTNGAGDMFAGAFLYGVTQGLTDQQAGDLASAAAARIVSTFGARLESSDYKELLEQFSA
ncbi:MAG: Ribokinase (EC [uncultured Thiotrichaceae bacterium]|uniref:Ribokinase (EC) n=1 Tax=uncultured Thiotrichaceae bacterium TaxID=298394 RepID=A0A6S6SU50_9GAMM|nr:MAG: Ribokinase (EC [uncultured Thiotrichaceae bacterium]